MSQRMWTDEENEFVSREYATKGCRFCAKSLNRSESSIMNHVNKMGLRREGKRNERAVDEQEILRVYSRLRSTRKTSAETRIPLYFVSRTIKRHKAAMPRLRKIEQNKEGVSKDYLGLMMTTQQIADKYGVSHDVIKKAVRRWGIVDNHKSNLRANRLRENGIWRSNTPRGNANKRYGKPPMGLRGWYKTRFFRSLKELTFMLETECRGQIWLSAETLFGILYVIDGEIHRYYPDFLVGNILYEIKPKSQHAHPIVKAKANAAKTFCLERGLEYKLIDVAANPCLIKEAYQKGIVSSHPKDQEKFIEWLSRCQQSDHV